MSEWVWIILAAAGVGLIFRHMCTAEPEVRQTDRQGRSNSAGRTDAASQPTAGPTPQPRPAPRPQPVSRPTGNGETGPMIYFANDPHGQGDREYRFNYKLVNGSWRAYILKMPSLRGRDAGGVVTHRLFENGNPNVCWVCWDSPVRTLEDMQTISRVWADHIQEYIATGKRFG